MKLLNRTNSNREFEAFLSRESDLVAFHDAIFGQGHFASKSLFTLQFRRKPLNVSISKLMIFLSFTNSDIATMMITVCRPEMFTGKQRQVFDAILATINHIGKPDICEVNRFCKEHDPSWNAADLFQFVSIQTLEDYDIHELESVVMEWFKSVKFKMAS